MLNNLPNFKKKIECCVVNLDNYNGNGTNWVCYGTTEKGQKSWYLDSYGLSRPNKILKYLGKDIIYSTFNIQNENV